MSERHATEQSWTPARLWRAIIQPSPFFVLDLRNSDEFALWHIEGRGPLPSLNVPYFDLLELEGDEDVEQAVVRAVPARLGDLLPRDGAILAVCAEGHTSGHVAAGLRRLGYAAFNLRGGMAAWGDYYHVVPVTDSGALSILQVQRPARGCLGYLVACGGEALVIDPARHTAIYRELAERHGWKIRGVLDTHVHADHISGAPALADGLGVPYRLHPYDAIHPIDKIPGALQYDYLREGQQLPLGRAPARILHIPGHTLGHVAFLVDERYLIAGDSLFIGSVARPDLGGDAEAWTPLLYRALRRIASLPDETVVLPAHFSGPGEMDGHGRFAAPLGRLRTGNPGMRKASGDEDAFRRYILESLPDFPKGYTEIKRINVGLAAADERRARELELGKNRCALNPAA